MKDRNIGENLTAVFLMCLSLYVIYQVNTLKLEQKKSKQVGRFSL